MKTKGFVFRPESFWVGLHYSEFNRRYCLNLLPCCTIWWIKKGGKIPDLAKV